MRVGIVTQSVDVLVPLREILEHGQHETLHATRVECLCKSVERAQLEVVITDEKLADGVGLDILRAMSRDFPAVLTALMVPNAESRGALDAARHGAAAIVPLPIERRATEACMRMLEHERVRRGGLRTLGQEAERFHGMLGTTPAMRECFRNIRKVGNTHATVLITGESGTGKELVANALHAESPRSKRPFIALNCSAIPSELVESELFGHTRGSFTGAARDRAGLFEAANGGTLFMDEIGDLGERAQAKVLRAIESGEVMRVGGTQATNVDVRIIAATNRPLASMVAQRTFREDLLYRLNVVPLHLPPLRERVDDIPLLAGEFVRRFATREGMPIRTLDAEAMAFLMRYEWPGNIRELRNAMEYALLMADEPVIRAKNLPPSILSRDSAAARARSAGAARTARQPDAGQLFADA